MRWVVKVVESRFAQRIFLMFPRAQFASALIVAAAHELWTKYKGIREALKQGGVEVSKEVYENRIEACRECPFFFKPLQTCGSALKREWKIVDAPMEGCQCFMPYKASIKSNCWWYDVTRGTRLALGWEQSLNSFPYEQPDSQS